MFLIMSRILFQIKTYKETSQYWVANNGITNQFSYQVNRDDQDRKSYYIDPFSEGQTDGSENFTAKVGEDCLKEKNENHDKDEIPIFQNMLEKVDSFSSWIEFIKIIDKDKKTKKCG